MISISKAILAGLGVKAGNKENATKILEAQQPLTFSHERKQDRFLVLKKDAPSSGSCGNFGGVSPAGYLDTAVRDLVGEVLVARYRRQKQQVESSGSSSSSDLSHEEYDEELWSTTSVELSAVGEQAEDHDQAQQLRRKQQRRKQKDRHSSEAQKILVFPYLQKFSTSTGSSGLPGSSVDRPLWTLLTAEIKVTAEDEQDPVVLEKEQEAGISPTQNPSPPRVVNLRVHTKLRLHLSGRSYSHRRSTSTGAGGMKSATTTSGNINASASSMETGGSQDFLSEDDEQVDLLSGPYQLISEDTRNSFESWIRGAFVGALRGRGCNRKDRDTNTPTASAGGQSSTREDRIESIECTLSAPDGIAAAGKTNAQQGHSTSENSGEVLMKKISLKLKFGGAPASGRDDHVKVSEAAGIDLRLDSDSSGVMVVFLADKIISNSVKPVPLSSEGGGGDPVLAASGAVSNSSASSFSSGTSSVGNLESSKNSDAVGIISAALLELVGGTPGEDAGTSSSSSGSSLTASSSSKTKTPFAIEKTARGIQEKLSPDMILQVRQQIEASFLARLSSSNLSNSNGGEQYAPKIVTHTQEVLPL